MNSPIPFLDAINSGMNYVVSGICLLFLGFIVVRYTISRIRKYEEAKQRGEEEYPVIKGLYFGLLLMVEIAILVLIVGFFPTIMQKQTGYPANVFRWILLYLVIVPLFFFMTFKYSGFRGLVSSFTFLTIGLVGWFYEHWVGFLLISLPLYALVAYFIYHIAQVVMPFSDPEDPKEKWRRFLAFLWYVIGTQHPFWMAKDRVARENEKRIDGNLLLELFKPGIAWSYSHQVMGISAGTNFKNVEGPGLFFIEGPCRLFALADLRRQIRTAELDTTTRDGVPIRVIVFTEFKIDHEDWPKKGWKTEDGKQLAEEIKINPLLADILRIDRKNGNFPYSTARVKSVLSTEGINTTPPSGENDEAFFWDEWVLMQIQNAARQVVSQRDLDQMWKPVDNEPKTSALDEMAKKIEKLVEPLLRRVGIQLLGARIVDFSIDKSSPIAKRQIDSWKTLWSQKITAAMAEAEAVEKEEIEKAHAYAKSALLDAIADSIQKARLEHVDLPRHVIALYYIHAIEEYIQKRPDSSGNKDTKESIEALKQFLMSS